MSASDPSTCIVAIVMCERITQPIQRGGGLVRVLHVHASFVNSQFGLLPCIL